jgi:hypothetical protein
VADTAEAFSCIRCAAAAHDKKQRNIEVEDEKMQRQANTPPINFALATKST